MVSANIYLIQDESSFIEREENYEIYQEIYGDPIYDVYEGDVRVVDFIFNEDSFANLVCAKIVQHEIHGKFVHDEFRANFGQASDSSGGGGRQEGLLWYRDSGHHVSGDFSMAVVQANNLLEDQSQLESAPLSTHGSGGPYGTFSASTMATALRLPASSMIICSTISKVSY
ncbi:hypothetical protein HID58_090437 [Brassica napus]|uniref:Uncharacterized protein n=1 Tax=Brassica napus TaxID=3708 RepID=A0ABQ7WZH2_BRANA|nr:hypothetical protein HID58_090437 [Brassica napus]